MYTLRLHGLGAHGRVVPSPLAQWTTEPSGALSSLWALVVVIPSRGIEPATARRRGLRLRQLPGWAVNPKALARMASARMGEVAHWLDLPLEDIRLAVELSVAQARRVSGAHGKPVQCAGAGCFGCCRGAVALTRGEFESLRPHVSPEAWERVRLLGDRLRDLKYRRHAMCPLLDVRTGACTVYEHRPLVCRAHLATSPRTWCWPELGDHEVETLTGPASLVLAYMTAVVERDGSEAVTQLALALLDTLPPTSED